MQKNSLGKLFKRQSPKLHAQRVSGGAQALGVRASANHATVEGELDSAVGKASDQGASTLGFTTY